MSALCPRNPAWRRWNEEMVRALKIGMHDVVGTHTHVPGIACANLARIVVPR